MVIRVIFCLSLSGFSPKHSEWEITEEQCYIVGPVIFHSTVLYDGISLGVLIEICYFHGGYSKLECNNDKLFLHSSGLNTDPEVEESTFISWTFATGRGCLW